jgi:hypothetical protein
MLGARKHGQFPADEGLVGNGQLGVPGTEGAGDRRHLRVAQRRTDFDASGTVVETTRRAVSSDQDWRHVLNLADGVEDLTGRTSRWPGTVRGW